MQGVEKTEETADFTPPDPAPRGIPRRQCVGSNAAPIHIERRQTQGTPRRYIHGRGVLLRDRSIYIAADSFPR